MTTSAVVIKDSISSSGHRLTTMQLRYPRFIHAEFMTHRLFSRNASSSRAIPVEKLIQDMEREIASPVWWGKNQPGMQANEELEASVKSQAKACWSEAADEAMYWAQTLHNLGAHKQIVNRLLEPFSHINVVVSATEWDNFYALRRHKDAQPEIHELADRMWEAQQASAPTLLKPGEWHLPYVDEADYNALNTASDETLKTDSDVRNLIKLSVARCARVSYLTHEGKKPNPAEDLKLYDRLVGSVQLHASPCEHQATPYHGWHANFQGWRQHRKQVEE